LSREDQSRYAELDRDGVFCNRLSRIWSQLLTLQCTAVFRKVPEGYIAFIEEFPGANTQGATLEEARTNLREAVALVVEANRTLAREDAALSLIP